MPKKRPAATNQLASQKRAHLMREIVETLLFVGLVFLIVQFAIVPKRVVDGSMEPHLLPDQLLVVNRVAYLFTGPSRGDVVMYYNPQNTNEECVGRVIAVPNDTVSISVNTITVDNVVLNETYVQNTQINEGVVAPTKLDSSHYFVLFDNRQYGGTADQNACTDSRAFGPLPKQNIIGRAVLVFWPLGQFGGISNYSDVFQNIH